MTHGNIPGGFQELSNTLNGIPNLLNNCMDVPDLGNKFQRFLALLMNPGFGIFGKIFTQGGQLVNQIASAQALLGQKRFYDYGY